MSLFLFTDNVWNLPKKNIVCQGLIEVPPEVKQIALEQYCSYILDAKKCLDPFYNESKHDSTFKDDEPQVNHWENLGAEWFDEIDTSEEELDPRVETNSTIVNADIAAKCCDRYRIEMDEWQDLVLKTTYKYCKGKYKAKPYIKYCKW